MRREELVEAGSRPLVALGFDAPLGSGVSPRCLRGFGRGSWWDVLHTCCRSEGHYGPCECGCGEKDDAHREHLHYSMSYPGQGDSE